MTEAIEWGPEIKVDGKPPEWLGADEKVLPQWDGEHWYSDAKKGSYADCVCGWASVTAIRLPADHSYYTRKETPVERFKRENPGLTADEILAKALEGGK